MDHAFGAEAETFFADGHVAGKAAVEIFARGFGDPRIDAGPQGLTDVEVFSRGISAWEGSPISTGSREVLNKMGVSISTKR